MGAEIRAKEWNSPLVGSSPDPGGKTIGKRNGCPLNKTPRHKLLGLFLLTALGCSGTSPLPAQAQDLVFAADEWCPYNCEPDAALPGLVVEVIAEVFGAEGMSTAYRVLPWARAIAEARAGTYVGIIGAGRTEAPDFVFPATSAFLACDAFYVVPGSDWSFDGLESLAGRRLGVIRDYSYGPLFETYIRIHEHDPERVFMATGEAPLPRLVQMLRAGRLDVVVENRNVMAWLLKGQGEQPPLREAGTVAQAEVFVAFSPADPRSARLAGIFDRGVQRLQESGRLAEISARYGILDPAVTAAKEPVR